MHDQEEVAVEQIPNTGSPTAGSTAGVPGPTSNQQTAAQLEAIYKAVKSGGSWFYWIAGLSLVNTFIVLFHGKVSFVLGLGFTQIFDGAIAEFGPKAAFICLPINLFVTGIYVLFGYFACRRARWAFITGLVFYSLDTLLFLLVREFFGLAFHCWALYSLYRGLKATNLAVQIKSAASEPGVPV